MKILLVSTLRDEGPHLLEWVAHHKAIGVTDFLLFSNDCADGTDAILDALAPAGVTHIRNQPPKGKSVQWNALREAWTHPLRKSADWIMCVDCDEFVNLRQNVPTLPALIEQCSEPDAILLPWRLFGHNQHAYTPNGLTTEMFTRAAPMPCNYPVGARQFKTLFCSKGPFRQIGVHRPRLKKDQQARWVDGSGNDMPAEFALNEQRITLYGFPAANDLVQLNHYSLRSAENFMLKRRRGLPNRKTKALDMTYWVERNFNTEVDDSIHWLLDATRSELSGLLSLPDVDRLYSEALTIQKAMFADLMREVENVKFFGRLLLAQSSVPLEDRMVGKLVSQFRSAV